MAGAALVTGGSRGIGAAAVRLLRERQWDIFSPPRSALDFADEPTLRFFERQIRKYNVALNAVVFCHGEWFSSAPEKRLYSAWYRQYSMRVVWPMELLEFLLCGAPEIIPRCVVMVSSTRGFIGGVETGPYAAACAAQIALMQGYAREWPDVRFNVVCPGLTDTDMGREVVASGGAAPGAAMQSAESVAAVIVGLVESDESGAVVRVVDGQATRARWVWE